MKTHLLQLLRSLLGWLLPDARVRDGLLGDLDELYRERRGRGRLSADLWYARQLASVALRYAPHRTWIWARGAAAGTRSGLRALGRARTFGWGAALLLGLGIGAVTTMFAIVDHLFARPLPYPDAERLIRVEGSQSHPALADLRGIRSVEAWAAASIDDAHLTGAGDPQRVGQARVTEGFFEMFGARAARGRLLTPGDFGGADVVVLSHGAWERIWGAGEDVVGATLVIDGAPVLVAGILAPAFSPPEALLDGAAADLWRPVDRSPPDARDRASRSLVVAGRLAPGARLDDAQVEASALEASRARAFPEIYLRRDGTVVELGLTGLQEATVGHLGGRLGLPMAGVTLLLLIACVNLAHLFMARGIGRAPEMALRRALGAGTPALVGQLLAESLLVAARGAVIGLGLAAAGLRLLLATTPEPLPRASSIALDGRVFVFSAVLAALTAVCFGLVPTLWAAGSPPGAALGSRGRGGTFGAGSRRVSEGLVMAEVALSLVLVFCAGLLTRSAFRLADEPLGFRVADVWTIRVGLPTDGQRGPWRERMERMADALERTPGVRSVTYGLSTPLEHVGGTCCWSRPVRRLDGSQGREATIHPFSGEHLDVLEPRLLAGRGWRDGEWTLAPALLNERLALTLFGSAREAVGREVAVGEAVHTVVGVVAEDRHYGPFREHGPAAYVPVESVPFTPDRLTLAVRTRGAAGEVPRLLREAVWTVEPELPLPVVRSMEEWVQLATARTRFDRWIFTALGVTALVLASGGLFGTLLFMVGAQRRELGIRLALGAGRGSVEALVLRRGLRTAACGLALGAVSALGAGRLLESRLFGLGGGDPLTLAAALAVLLSTSAIACWLPAHRAGSVDPVETMRQE